MYYGDESHADQGVDEMWRPNLGKRDPFVKRCTRLRVPGHVRQIILQSIAIVFDKRKSDSLKSIK